MRKCVLVVLILVIAAHGFADEPSAWNASLHLYPQVTLPDPGLFDIFYNQPAFHFPVSPGMSFGTSFTLRFPELRWLYGALEARFDMNGQQSYYEVDQSILLFSGSAGVGLWLDLGRYLSLRADLNGGMWYGVFTQPTAFPTGLGWLLSTKVNASINFTPYWSIGGGIGLTMYQQYSTFAATIETAFHFPNAKTAKPGAREPLPAQPEQQQPQESTPPQPLETTSPGQDQQGVSIDDVALGTIFPVFHKYYDDHPVGKIKIRNLEKSPISDVRVSFQIKQYMDAAKQSIPVSQIGAGESQEIELFALFKDTILEITEPTKVFGEIMVSYTLGGKKQSASRVETVRLQDRYSMTWDDDRKPAAFVTAGDTSVLTFARNVSAVLKDAGNREINQWVSLAMAIHETLSLYGITYIVDPKGSYAELSQQMDVIDFLQFPRQTLEYKGGDCDDLSILYCALLEAVGAETAFITVPGHIFMAVSLGLDPDAAREQFQRADELIFKDGKTWVPIEVTERKGGFLQAWLQGAKEWRENLARNQAGFLPVHDAWKTFEPVGLPGEGKTIVLPPGDKMVAAYSQEMIRFVDREIYPRMAKIQADMQKAGETPKLLNQLGVLYARYGLLDRAEAQLQKAIKKEEYVPALLNLGNLSYLRNEREKALTYYERASRKEPDNAKVLLGLARANHDLENFGVVAKLYATLKGLDADLALRFSYLDLKGEEATRASEIGQVKGVVLWEE